jgi:hypothetical protein
MSALRLPKDEPLARNLVEAIHAGRIETVKELVQAHPGLASAQIVDEKGGSGTPLHAAADWPGFFPNGPEIVAVLIDAGATTILSSDFLPLLAVAIPPRHHLAGLHDTIPASSRPSNTSSINATASCAEPLPLSPHGSETAARSGQPRARRAGRRRPDSDEGDRRDGRRRGTGRAREITAEDFFVGVFATSLRQGELVTAVEGSWSSARAAGAACEKHRHPASGYAVAGVAALVQLGGRTCTSARVAAGGVTGTPENAAAATDAMSGVGPGDEATVAAAAATVASALAGAVGHTYASAEYRVHLATVLVKRALTSALEAEQKG